jgi:hypothetical protein
MNREGSKPIGGFFELELPNKKMEYHKDAFALSTGRACMHTILKIEKPILVYIPFYTCYALYEPILQLGIDIKFYPINELMEPRHNPLLNDKEMFVYINYFGLKNKLCNELSEKYGKNIIIDNTHNFFNFGYEKSYSFTSARKYFGVPDGAYLYGGSLDGISRNKNTSISHNVKRLEGLFECAYTEYLHEEKKFNTNILRISKISERLLQNVDYDFVINRRVENYNYLHSKLKDLNDFKFNLKIERGVVPFCYPFFPKKNIEKCFFHKLKIFVPTLWPDILDRDNKNKFSFEGGVVNRLIPLPIDHRYNLEDMRIIIDAIQRKMNE